MVTHEDFAALVRRPDRRGRRRADRGRPRSRARRRGDVGASVLRAELKGLLARKLRLALTAFAIALGVTLMAGTYIFTDTINSAFDTIFQKTEQGTDRRPDAARRRSATPTTRATPRWRSRRRSLPRVRAVPGVAEASGQIFSTGTIFDRKGDAVGRLGSSFIASLQVAPFSALSVVTGRLPRSADEMVLDKAAAQKGPLQGRRPGGRAGVGSAQELPVGRHGAHRRRRLVRRDEHRGHDPAEAQRATAHEGHSPRSTWRRRSRSRPTSCATGCRPLCTTAR